LSTTNPTWPDPGANPGRRGGKPATNRLSYGAALCWGFIVCRYLLIVKFACRFVETIITIRNICLTTYLRSKFILSILLLFEARYSSRKRDAEIFVVLTVRPTTEQSWFAHKTKNRRNSAVPNAAGIESVCMYTSKHSYKVCLMAVWLETSLYVILTNVIKREWLMERVNAIFLRGNTRDASQEY
jgi:hypothetical protein